MSEQALALKLKERFNALKSLRIPFEQIWGETADFVMPRRAPAFDTVLGPSSRAGAVLFDITAVNANMTLANGQLAWMSPMESAWFALEPPPGRESDEVKMWLGKCSEIMRYELANGNFYTTIHEFYLDRSYAGTACLYLEEGKNESLNFQHWPTGTYVIDEDSEGRVDTIMREFHLTPRQAAQKFGEDALSPKMREGLREGGAKAQEKFKIIHAIYPREPWERDVEKRDPENMPIASVYLEADGDHVIRVGGYREMPAFVSRYLEWGSMTGSLYGWSPAFVALPEARQLNFLAKMSDALAEKLAFPPLLIPEELEGEVDPNANGTTYFSRDVRDALPRPLSDAGDYRPQLERIQARQQAIKDAFHVDLFAMFSQLDKQMTAREVAERSQEKLIQFSPTFARMTTELFNPMLRRVFSLLLEAGRLPLPPDSARTQISETEDFVEPPEIVYSSRIALALRALPSIAYYRAVERVQVVAGFKPDVVDNYDFDKAEREVGLIDGMRPDWFVDTEDRDASRQARAEMAAQQAQAEQAAMAAKAVGDIGRVPPGSPVAGAIAGGLPV